MTDLSPEPTGSNNDLKQMKNLSSNGEKKSHTRFIPYEISKA